MLELVRRRMVHYQEIELLRPQPNLRHISFREYDHYQQKFMQYLLMEDTRPDDV